MKSTWSSSSCAKASCARIRCPMCGGLNPPPRIPIRKLGAVPPARVLRAPPRYWHGDHRLRPHLAGALDHVLERAELAHPDRAARVELLRRVADLRAHPEHAAVGETRRRVHIHGRGVD